MQEATFRPINRKISMALEPDINSHNCSDLNLRPVY